jgi:hypothetical protein
MGLHSKCTFEQPTRCLSVILVIAAEVYRPAQLLGRIAFQQVHVELDLRFFGQLDPISGRSRKRLWTAMSYNELSSKTRLLVRSLKLVHAIRAFGPALDVRNGMVFRLASDSIYPKRCECRCDLSELADVSDNGLKGRLYCAHFDLLDASISIFSQITEAVPKPIHIWRVLSLISLEND